MLFAILTLALQAFSPALAFTPAQSVSTPESGAAVLAGANCTRPNSDAKYLDGPPPSLPRGSNFKGAAVAVLTIAPNGNIVHASIAKSSGNLLIDQAVLDAARRGEYSPKLVNCKPVEGKYLFRAEFKPDGH